MAGFGGIGKRVGKFAGPVFSQVGEEFIDEVFVGDELEHV